VLHVLRREVDVVMSDIEAVATPVLGWEPYPPEPPAFTPSDHNAKPSAKKEKKVKKEKREKKEKKGKKKRKADDE